MAETPMEGLADYLRAQAGEAFYRGGEERLRHWASEVEAARAPDTRSERERFEALYGKRGETQLPMSSWDAFFDVWQARAREAAAVKDSLTTRPDDWLKEALDGATFAEVRMDGSYQRCSEWNADSVIVPLSKWNALRARPASPTPSVDAERYRWLRDWLMQGRLRAEVMPDAHFRHYQTEEVDAAIDAARLAIKEKP